jgi:hypothetical protein
MSKLICLSLLTVTASTVGVVIALSGKNPSTVQKTEPSSISQQENIVKAQKLQDDLEAACKARNMQACEQIGITKEDVESFDEFDRVLAKHKDDMEKIRQGRDITNKSQQ